MAVHAYTASYVRKADDSAESVPPRLMRREGIVALKKRRFRRATDSNHPHPIAPNVA